MSNWYKIPKPGIMPAREHRIIIQGINVVIGAVLGFVLVGSEGLPVYDFGALLVISMVIVVLILYLESSDYVLFHAVLTAIAILSFPYVTEELFSLTKVPKLQPTLAIWAIMILLAQLIPHEEAESDRHANHNKKIKSEIP